MTLIEKIIDKGVTRAYNGDYGKTFGETLKDVLREGLVNYAESIIPSERPHAEEQVWNQYEVKGYNKCIEDMKKTIEQDSLDLPTN